MRSAQELNSLALKTRKIWNEDTYSPIDIFAIINGWKDKKITLVKYPMSSRISGMCTKVSILRLLTEDKDLHWRMSCTMCCTKKICNG